MSSTRRLWACAVSTMSTSTPASASVIARAHESAPDPDRRTDQQPAVAVLGGERVLLGLDEVLDRDQPGQPAVAVDDRQLLDLVAAQQAKRGIGGDTLAAR